MRSMEPGGASRSGEPREPGMRSMWSRGGGGSRSGEPGAGHAVHQEPGGRLARSSRVSESNLSEPSRAGPDAVPCSCYTKRSDQNDNGVTGYPRIPDPPLRFPRVRGDLTVWARRVKPCDIVYERNTYLYDNLSSPRDGPRVQWGNAQGGRVESRVHWSHQLRLGCSLLVSELRGTGGGPSAGLSNELIQPVHQLRPRLHPRVIVRALGHLVHLDGGRGDGG